MKTTDNWQASRLPGLVGFLILIRSVHQMCPFPILPSLHQYHSCATGIAIDQAESSQ